MVIYQSLNNLKLHNMISKFLKKTGGVILGIITLLMLVWLVIEFYLALLLAGV